MIKPEDFPEEDRKKLRDIGNRVREASKASEIKDGKMTGICGARSVISLVAGMPVLEQYPHEPLDDLRFRFTMDPRVGFEFFDSNRKYAECRFCGALYFEADGRKNDVR